MSEEMILIDVHQMRREIEEQISLLSSGHLYDVHQELGELNESASLSYFREKEAILYDSYQELISRLKEAKGMCDLLEEYQLAYQRMQASLKQKKVLEDTNIRLKKCLYEDVKRVRPDGTSYIATVKNESTQTQMNANIARMQTIDFDVENLKQVMKSIELGIEKVLGKDLHEN